MLSVSWRLSSIAQGLCHMHAADLLRLRQIGNRARHSQYAGITTRREAHRLCGLCQQLAARPVGARHFFPQIAVDLCIGPHAITIIAPCLRSEARRVGNECVSTVRSWWSTYT